MGRISLHPFWELMKREKAGHSKCCAPIFSHAAGGSASSGFSILKRLTPRMLKPITFP